MDDSQLNEGLGDGVSYRGRLYIELMVEILSGGAESKSLSRTKGGKTGTKDPKTAAGPGGEEEKSKSIGPEVMPVEPLQKVKSDCISPIYLVGYISMHKQNKTCTLKKNILRSV